MLTFPNLPAPIERLIPKIVKPIASVPPLARFLSRKVINQFGYATTLRPRPLSLASDYTSWLSLTDKSYSGRHLPPSTPEYRAGLPSEADVTALFRRDTELLSTDTSITFMFFAQWFTDSFLRTRSHRLPQERVQPRDRHVPDLRPHDHPDQPAALGRRRPSEEPAHRRRGVPGLSVRNLASRAPRWSSRQSSTDCSTRPSSPTSFSPAPLTTGRTRSSPSDSNTATRQSAAPC